MRRTVATITGLIVGVGGAVAAAAPAQAAPSCTTYVSNTTISGRKVTRLWVTGTQINRRVYSFRLTWGWSDTVSTYIPTYRVYDAPRHAPLHLAEGWRNGEKCRTWWPGRLF